MYSEEFSLYTYLPMFIQIFLCYLYACIVLAEGKDGPYEYKFRTCSYVKEVDNVTVVPEAAFHICRLSMEKRTEICKGALKEDFCEYNRIKYRDDVPWEEEKLYEVFLNGIFYQGKRAPFVVSACKCPTAPPMYFKDGTNGTDIRVYVDLLGKEKEFGFTVSLKKDVTSEQMF